MNAVFAQDKRQLVNVLVEEGVLKFENPLFPVYFDLRSPEYSPAGPLTSDLVGLTALCMWRKLSGLKLSFQAVAGGSDDLFAKVLADMCGVPFVIPRESYPSWVNDVLVVDGLAVSADPLVQACRALCREGHVRVKDAFVLVDYQLDALSALAGMGVGLHSLFTLSEFLQICVDEDLMIPNIRDAILLGISPHQS